MARNFYWISCLIAVVLLAAVLVSCTGNGRRGLGGSQTTDGQIQTPVTDSNPSFPESGGFPSLPNDAYVNPVDILSRRGSILAELLLKGNEFFLADADASTDDVEETCQLVASAPDRCWAMYRFENIVIADGPDLLTVTLSSQPDDYLVGWSDYSSNAWVWTKVTAPSGEDNCPLPVGTQPVSPGGNVFALVTVMDAQQATLAQVKLALDTDAPPPVGLSASDGTRGDLVQLSWTDPATTYPGLVYENVKVERALDPRGPWDEIGEAASGITSYDDIHEGTGGGQNNVSYNLALYYRLGTVVAGVKGPTGLSDSGLRVLADVAGLGATDGAYYTKVEINWDAITEADSYDLYYKQTSQGSETWTLLVNVAGTLFEHTASEPPGKPCEQMVDYDYRAKGRFLEDESINFSNIDSGFRAVGNVENLSATDGTHHDKVVVNWDEVPTAENYNLYYKETSQDETGWGLLATINDGSTTSFDHTYAAPVGKECAHNLSYDYRAKASREGDESPQYSNVDDGYRLLGDVGGMAATDGDFYDKVDLTWTTVGGADGYELEYLNTEGGTPASWTVLETLSGGSTDTFEHTVSAPAGKECEDNVTYNYRARATFNADRSVGYSNTDTGYRIVQAPADVAATDEAYPDKIVLTWTQSTNATGYKIYRDGQTEGDLLDTVGDVAEYEDTTVGDYDAHTYWLRATNAAGESVFSSSDTGECIEWQIHDVVSMGTLYGSVEQIMNPISLAIIAGKPATTYIFRPTSSKSSLCYARSTTDVPTAESDWVTYTLHGDGSQIFGTYNGLAVVDGKAAIAYYYASGAFTQSLRFARATTAEPGGSDWQKHEVHSAFNWNIGMWCTIANINGVPCIAYSRGSSGGGSVLSYARASSVTPSSNSDWTLSNIPSPYWSTGTSLAEIAGVPVTAYLQDDIDDMRIAVSPNADGSGTWQIHTLDPASPRWPYPSLGENQGLPNVSYRAGGVKFARATVAAPESVDDWVVMTPDTVGGRANSLAFIDGVPIIAYCDATGYDLKVARAKTSTPSNDDDWYIHTVDSEGQTGWYCSIEVLDGKPVIAYCKAGHESGTAATLKFARAL